MSHSPPASRAPEDRGRGSPLRLRVARRRGEDPKTTRSTNCGPHQGTLLQRCCRTLTTRAVPARVAGGRSGRRTSSGSSSRAAGVTGSSSRTGRPSIVTPGAPVSRTPLERARRAQEGTGTRCLRCGKGRQDYPFVLTHGEGKGTEKDCVLPQVSGLSRMLRV